MSYESFRNDVSARLLDILPDSASLAPILAAIDAAAAPFEFSRRCTDLIVTDGVPDAVRLYIASKAVQNIAKGTLANYYRALRLFFQHVKLPLEKVSANDIRLYLYFYKQSRNVQDGTIESLRIILNGFFEWCTDEDLLQKNPCRRVHSVKAASHERLPLNALELETVRQSCHSLREKAMVDFMYSTACRVSEFSAMNISDINWQEHTVRIRHGKGDKARTTFLNAESEVSLKAYLATREDDSDALFVTVRAPHRRMGVKSIQDEVARIVSRCSLSVHVTPHIFRHTAASLALQRGMPIDQVQRFLGHAKIQTTLRYAKLLDCDVKISHGKYVA